jgi:hypothetical protein
VTRSLRIAPGLDLPVDVVTQPIAILARRGAGKTYTASVVVEEVIGAKVPVVVLDPTGAWWGIRSSADGSEAGLPVVIFGGEHGDVPLDEADGHEIANVVLEHPGAYVVDLSGFPSRRAEQRFAGDFLERLYRSKRRETGPLLVVVDEADMFAPQRPGKEQLRTLGALEAIVRRGRIKGLGDLLITQRAAVLNKNVLTQTEVLVVMQTTGPQDRAAIDEWIEGNGSREERTEVLDSLASLERGEAWVWSPAFLRILQRVRIRARTTFDSSRTPGAGETAIAPRAFAQVDLEALGARIAATREKAKAEDPAELRKRIRELETAAKEAANFPRIIPEPEVREVRIEVPVLNGQVGELRDVVRELASVGDRFAELGVRILDRADSITAAIARVTTQGGPVETGAGASIRTAVLPGAATRGAASLRRSPEPEAARPAVAQLGGSPSDVSLGKAERLILAALATYPQGRTRTQVAILTGYSSRGGGFGNALSRLRSLGLVEGGREDLRITGAGVEAAGDVQPLPTGRALLDHWLGQLGKAERLALEALADVYPGAMTREELGAATGYEPTGGGFGNALSKLRTLELIRGDSRALQASPDLADA